MENSDNEQALLLEAFTTFSEASLQLEKSYNELKDHSLRLDHELQETNEKLRHSLIEQEAVSKDDRQRAGEPVVIGVARPVA